MEAFLGKITQHAMNYAIRSGIGITASYAFRQSSRLLKTVDDDGDRQEFRSLQERLESKIRILSPAIDLIELISARGNTTLESAVSLTKDLRWEIQALGVRLAKAATAEEASRRNQTKVKSRPDHEKEIREIVQDIRNLLARIEEAVPFINLAITTSGASLSTTLPPSVSPSRLLQASTFLTAADTRYSMDPRTPVQVGPIFTLSLYMLFTGHYRRNEKKEVIARETTFKEVIHKARVRLMRIPLQSIHDSSDPIMQSVELGEEGAPMMTGEHKRNEYSYRLEIIEDLEDDRVHEFEDGEPQPGPYGDVRLAGIREFLPIYQVSRIFYADTGKILGIGNPEDTHSAVLLLRRDINAKEPRRMMEEFEKDPNIYEDPPEHLEEEKTSESGDDSQDDINEQIRKESSAATLGELVQEAQTTVDQRWRLPANLDTEWLAFEVYTEPEDSSSEDEQDVNDDSAYISHRPSSSGAAQNNYGLIDRLDNLHLDQGSAVVPVPSQQLRSSPPVSIFAPPKPATVGSIRTALSLLEMLIRLTALQQYQQASHLSIHDEFLTFFLCESSNTGAGADAELRKRTRREAVTKMGFDPYDESPVKQRGDNWDQYQNQGQEEYGGYSRGHTPYDEPDHRNGYPSPQQGWMRERNSTTPEPWLLRSREHSSAPRQSPPNIPPSSPMPPHRPQRKSTRPLDRVQHSSLGAKGSPLGRGMSVETDSTLGTSPGSPTLVDRLNQD
ncbi:Ran-binding-domain-containing protein [Stipitochalara longipes BDJ]|nr:Ran-binding-domain-containing protein [Stipitochalara longipes BDJ]